MQKKNINKPLIHSKYPLTIFLIILSFVTLLSFVKIFTDLNLENYDWDPETENEILFDNIKQFVFMLVINVVLFFLRKSSSKTPILMFDGRSLFVKRPKEGTEEIPMTSIFEINRPVIQPSRNTNKRVIYYLNNGKKEKFTVFVIQRNNFDQFKKITKKRNPQVKITGFF